MLIVFASVLFLVASCEAQGVCRDIGECYNDFGELDRRSGNRLRTAQTLVPQMNFVCDGNITALTASLYLQSFSWGVVLPRGFFFQIWEDIDPSPSTVNYSLVTQRPFRVTVTSAESYGFDVDPPIPVSSGQFFGYSPDYVEWSTVVNSATFRGTYIAHLTGTFSPGLTLSQQTASTPTTAWATADASLYYTSSTHISPHVTIQFTSTTSCTSAMSTSMMESSSMMASSSVMDSSGVMTTESSSVQVSPSTSQTTESVSVSKGSASKSPDIKPTPPASSKGSASESPDIKPTPSASTKTDPSTTPSASPGGGSSDSGAGQVLPVWGMIFTVAGIVVALLDPGHRFYY